MVWRGRGCGWGGERVGLWAGVSCGVALAVVAGLSALAMCGEGWRRQRTAAGGGAQLRRGW